MEQTQNADKTISVRQLKELMNTIEGNLTTWPANFRKTELTNLPLESSLKGLRMK